MNLFEVIMLDAILILFPLLVYNLFLVSNKNINNRIKSIMFAFFIFTSCYLVYRYNYYNSIVNLLVLNSLVLISYIKKHYYVANSITICMIIMYYSQYNYTLLLIIPSLLLNLIYLLKKRYNLSDFVFIDCFLFIYYLIVIFWLQLFNSHLLSKINIYQLLFIMSLNYIIIHIIYYLYNQGESIIKYHLSYKELQKEKQIRLSLFKITHEIKNPIAVIKAYLDMLSIHNQKQVEKYIPIISSEIDRLLILLQDFMLINKNSVELDIMDINMLIEEVTKSLNPMLKENNIDLKLDIIDDEILINGDYKRLSQVLINILKNSIEAMDKKRGKIIISERIKKNVINIDIEDNGSGISKENLKKIKKPFYTTKSSGTGLGVSLSSEIIEAHEGLIEYSSQEGKGTKVNIVLPLDRKEDVYEQPITVYN